MTKLAASLAKVKALLANAKPTITVVAGIASQAIALGLLNGTALTIAQAILAAATVVGVHVTARPPKTAPPADKGLNVRGVVGVAEAALTSAIGAATVTTPPPAPATPAAPPAVPPVAGQ